MTGSELITAAIEEVLNPSAKLSDVLLKLQVIAYLELKNLLRVYSNIAVIEFDTDASLIFRHLKLTKLPVKTMDLKIASIALANDATLLTRNLRDFAKVPGLKVEDWSA